MPRSQLLRSVLPALLLAASAHSSHGQGPVAYNRSVQGSEWSVSPSPTGSTVSGVLHVSSTPDDIRDLSTRVALSVNGVVVGGGGGGGGGGIDVRIKVGPGIPNPFGGPADCQPFCIINCPPTNVCGPFSPMDCMCMSNDFAPPPGTSGIPITYEVAALSPGDVIGIGISPAPDQAGSAPLPEIDSTDDNAFVVVPIPGGHNRVIKPASIRYGRTPEGTFAIAGDVSIRSTPDGAIRDLSYDVIVLVNGVPIGSGGGSGGCPTTIITVGTGQQIGGAFPPLFSCAEWCLTCQYTLGNPNGNICFPPNISDLPFCFCDTNCSTARIIPGNGWQVGVPSLNPSDQVTAIIVPHAGSLPEVSTADDASTARVRDMNLCRVDDNNSGAADLGDVFSFLNAWFANSPNADFNSIDGVTLQDIFDFLNAWFAGC